MTDLGSPVHASSSLTADRIAGWLRPRRTTQLRLLHDYVATDSQWSNPVGVRTLARGVAEGLHELGFTTRVEPQPAVAPEDRWLAELLAPGVEYEALTETIVCKRPGVGSDAILLLVDADTAFQGGEAGDVPFRVDGDVVYGTGVADMKGGLVVLLEALRALHALEAATPPITVVIAGDEQAGSLGSRAVIEREAQACSLALCLECARDGGKLLATRAHIGVGLIEAHGREAHAGTARASGVSAIDALARAVPAVDAITDEPHTLVTVTMIEGGRRRSVVPGSARAVVDLRAADRRRWQQMVGRLEATVAGVSARADLILRTAVHRPGIPWTDATDEMLAVLGTLARALGFPLRATRSMAAGSSAFAGSAGLTVIDGLGPAGSHLMTDREQISVSGIAERAALLAAFIDRLTTHPFRKRTTMSNPEPNKKVNR